MSYLKAIPSQAVDIASHVFKVYEEEAMNAVLAVPLSRERERERERERANLLSTTASYNIISQNIKRCHYNIGVLPRCDYGNSKQMGLKYLLNTDSNRD